MSVRRWAGDNYDSDSVYRRAVATWLVVTVEWLLSASLTLVPVTLLYAALDGWLVAWSLQIWTLVWVAFTVITMTELEGFNRRRLFGMERLRPKAGD